MSDKKIELVQKNNNGLIVGICIIVLVVLVAATSKLWLPDSRDNVTYHKNLGLNLTLVEVVPLDKEATYTVDKSNNIAEVEFNTMYFASDDKYNLQYYITADDELELPVKVIRGKKAAKEGNVRLEQQVILQFRVPAEFHFIKIKMYQDEIEEETIIIDYRDFIEGSIEEKGDNYLIERETVQEEKVTLEKKIETLKKIISENESDLETVQNKLKGKLSTSNKKAYTKKESSITKYLREKQLELKKAEGRYEQIKDL